MGNPKGTVFIAILVSGALQWSCSRKSGTIAGTVDIAGSWTTYTVAEGLPCDAVAAIAFGPRNDFWCVPVVEGGMGIVHFDGSTWKRYSTNDGLGSNAIIWFENTLTVSSDGVLWVGTFGGGVSRFDGQTWKTYTTKDGLLSNQVTAVAVAPDGNLWCTHPAPDCGISRFNGETWTVYGADKLGVSFCNLINIVFDSDGTLWASGSQVVLRYHNQVWTPFSGETGMEPPVAIYMDVGRDGKIWIGGGGGVSCFDGSKWTPYSLDEMGAGGSVEGFIPLAVDPDNVLWVGVYGKGVFRYDGHGWNKFTSKGGPFLTNVMSITIAPNGAIWFGTETGISRYTPPEDG